MKDLLLCDDRVVDMMRAEGDRQVAKWGVQDRTPFEWMTYLTEEVGELAEAIAEDAYGVYGQDEHTASHVVAEAIQVMTLAAKIAEMYLNTDQSRSDGR